MLAPRPRTTPGAHRHGSAGPTPSSRPLFPTLADTNTADPCRPGLRPPGPGRCYPWGASEAPIVRLLDHLATLGLKSNAAREALRSGKVRLDGVPVSDAGRQVDPTHVRYDPNTPRVVVGRDAAVLWYDPHLAVMWKPPHMLAVPAPGRKDTANLLQYAGQRLGRAYPVHRLDEETSGLMLVARTIEAQEAIKALLEAHDIERAYLALVRGAFPDGPAREIRTMIVRDRGDGLRGSGPGGKPAVTWIARVESYGRASLVEARLETGRTHQVRIHLAELGHPVLGDPLYGDRGVQRMAPRLALHAARLAFQHPFTKAPLRFVAPLADDLEVLRRQLAEPRAEAPARPAREGRRRR